jgi:hypothetical protein
MRYAQRQTLEGKGVLEDGRQEESRSMVASWEGNYAEDDGLLSRDRRTDASWLHLEADRVCA